MPRTRINPRGLELYYEVTGSGAPIVVIPGGLMTIAQMTRLISALAETRQVITLEPQAQGHTADIPAPLTYENLADDVADLLRELGHERVDVCGFSMGAGVALQTAIRHPSMVRKLVFLSGVFRGDGEFAEVRKFEATFAPDNPMLGGNRKAYHAVGGNDDGWAALVEKTRLLLGTEYDWSAGVAALSMPVLIVNADSDVQPVAHALDLFKLLGGDTAASAMGGSNRAQLAVLPGTNHFNLTSRIDLLLPMLTDFLA